jgi:hypothetical protein
MSIISNRWMLLSALFLSACSFTTGHGPIITEDYQLEEFSGVVLEGSFDLLLAQGDERKVSVTGNQDMVERLVVTVENHELHVSLKPGAYTNYTLKVNVTLPHFKRLKLDGSGDIVVGDFKGLDDVEVLLEGSGNIRSDGILHVAGTVNCLLDGSGDVGLKLNALTVKAKLEGSGDIDLSGKATELIAELEGSGDVNSFGLEVLRCTAELEGSGDIKVNVAEQLHATLDGSGDIAYHGKPDVKSQLAGSGSIHPAD